MSVDPDATTVAICRLPLDFYTLGNVSPIELLRRSGYKAVRSEVTIERLSACLREHPSWVDPWFRWSEDNRSTPAWYVREVRPGEYELGSVDRHGSVTPRLVLDDKVAACAEYIHRRVAQIADWRGRLDGGASGR
jgi:hypothetical protein